MDEVAGTGMITIKVLLFSILREKVGKNEITVSANSALTGKLLLDQLALDYGAIQDFRSVIRIAVNESYVTEEHALCNGDEVALITPVSGG